MSKTGLSMSQLQDYHEILAVKHAFLRAADELDSDAMVAGFTEDCVCYYGPGLELRGRTALRDWYGDSEQKVTAVSNHQIHNFELIFLSDDEASSRCILQSWRRYRDYPERPDRTRHARYFDTWKRTNQGWLQSGTYYSVQGELNGDEPERQLEPEPTWPPVPSQR